MERKRKRIWALLVAGLLVVAACDAGGEEGDTSTSAATCGTG